MKIRAKLLFIFMAAIAGSAIVFAWGVTRYARRQFETASARRTDAVVAQFKRELAEQGAEVTRTVETIAQTEGSVRMALDLTRPQADGSVYASDATGLATLHHLEFVEIVNDDGTLVSSAQWPERAGSKNEWVTRENDWDNQPAFLRQMELPGNAELGLIAVRPIHVGEKKVYIIGGQRLNERLLAQIALPPGTRVLLYRNLEPPIALADLLDGQGPAADAARFLPMIESVKSSARNPNASTATRAYELSSISPGSSTGNAGNRANTESFVALPLTGRMNELLGVLLTGNSRSELAGFVNYVRLLAALISATGILLCMILSWWISARVARPVARVRAGMRAVSAGKWNFQLPAATGELAAEFNEMTRRISDEHERLLQTERVASWREVARRLANELKEPLFPLQITVESLVRAQQEKPNRFGEIFAESKSALQGEVQNLRSIVARFGEFAKMQPPRLQAADINQTARAALKTLEPQFSAHGRPSIMPELYLEEGLPAIQADPERLQRALEKLLAAAIEGMPTGGTLTLRTWEKLDVVRLEISDTGAGTRGENGRMFMPYEAGRANDAELGLATVQAIVSDHGAKLHVESAPGAGTTFRIEFPVAAVGSAAAAPAAARTNEKARSVRKGETRAASGSKAARAPERAPEPVPQPVSEQVSGGASQRVVERAPEREPEGTSEAAVVPNENARGTLTYR